jgi:hypothetical protein
MKPSALLKIALRKTSAAAGLDAQIAENNAMLTGLNVGPRPGITAKPKSVDDQVAENNKAFRVKGESKSPLIPPGRPGTNEGPALAAAPPAPKPWKPGDALGAFPQFPPRPAADVPSSPTFGVKPQDPGVMARISDWVQDPANQKYLIGGGAIGAAGLLAYMLSRDGSPKKRRRLAVA